MKNKLLFYIVFAISTSFAQVPNSIVLDNAISFSKDRYDNVFYITENQDVKKYGDNYLIYSSQKRKKITNIEAWNSIRIFLFSKEFQEYTVLDKYLTELYTRSFKLEHVGFASFTTLALDGNIWLFDNTDFSLKKINISNGNKISTTGLNLIIDESENEILFMKEYGNYLYVSTVHNGVLVFDNMGTYKKKLPFNNLSFFDFKNEKMYYLEKGNINYFDLIKLELKVSESLMNASKILITEDNSFLIK